MKKSKLEKCIFCHKPKRKNDSDNFILERAKTCFVMLNAFPYNNGHLLISPYRHIKDVAQLSNSEREELFRLISKYESRIYQTLNAEGINIGINIGKASGAGFAEHIHIHMVPRWIGDTNFMPALSNTKIIPESLSSIYKKLKNA